MQNAGVSYDFEFSCRAASFTQIEVKMPEGSAEARRQAGVFRG